MIYSLIRPLLFRLDAETAHHLTLDALQLAHRFGLISRPKSEPRHCRVMGLDFPNRLGLAAGLDKNGEYIDALAELGFGSIEIGTTTPRPQPGNPKPRLFRLPQHRAIINRMGFNNQGVDRLIENVKRAKYRGILGINIGKNFDTPIERAADDYLLCLNKVYPYASYVAINISSPNTKNLRQLQQGEELEKLLGVLKEEQRLLADRHGKYVPLAVKIAPDLDDEAIDRVAGLLVAHAIDAVIATNTTLGREGIGGPHANEAGGLSGAPLCELATRVISRLSATLGGKIPIIGVGGIQSGEDARAKIAAGASLVQIYSGLIYRGPELVPQIIEALSQGE